MVLICRGTQVYATDVTLAKTALNMSTAHDRDPVTMQLCLDFVNGYAIDLKRPHLELLYLLADAQYLGLIELQMLIRMGIDGKITYAVPSSILTKVQEHQESPTSLTIIESNQSFAESETQDLTEDQKDLPVEQPLKEEEATEQEVPYFVREEELNLTNEPSLPTFESTIAPSQVGSTPASKPFLQTSKNPTPKIRNKSFLELQEFIDLY